MNRYIVHVELKLWEQWVIKLETTAGKRKNTKTRRRVWLKHTCKRATAFCHCMPNPQAMIAAATTSKHADMLKRVGEAGEESC